MIHWGLLVVVCVENTKNDNGAPVQLYLYHLYSNCFLVWFGSLFPILYLDLNPPIDPSTFYLYPPTISFTLFISNHWLIPFANQILFYSGRLFQ